MCAFGVAIVIERDTAASQQSPSSSRRTRLCEIKQRSDSLSLHAFTNHSSQAADSAKAGHMLRLGTQLGAKLSAPISYLGRPRSLGLLLMGMKSVAVIVFTYF